MMSQCLHQVENPIAFSASPLARYLSIFHLHARYALLLVWPRHLSADWSFACVPLIETWDDPRNLMSLTLYGFIALTVVLARPWELLRDYRHSALHTNRQDQGEHAPLRFPPWQYEAFLIPATLILPAHYIDIKIY